MKRIAIIAPGSRGDVQPYIALGKGLQNAGNSVRLVTHINFQDLVQAYGLEFWPVEGDVKEIVESDVMRERVEKGNFLFLMAQMAKEARRGGLRLAEGGLAACQGMDLVVAGMGGLFIGLALSEKMDLPFLQAYLVPFTPSREFASVLVSRPQKWMGGSIYRFSHHLTRQVIWQGFRSADGLARREVLGLPYASFWGPYRSERMLRLPILYGFSPSVIPPPQDWDEDIHITGYWSLDAEEDWVPSKNLQNFLEGGPPPVYIGFGSMSNRKPEETAELVIKALAQSHQRGILLSGWGGLKGSDLPESILMVDSIPHAWLFPRMAAIVHHGGAGTTAASLRAGVPTVTVPFFGDQPFWGRRIAELGAGPAPIPRKKLTEARLAQAIQKAVTDESMCQSAARLGAEIQAEDGVGRAVEIIANLYPRLT